MRILFIHQNAPGQFRHLAPSLATHPGNEIVFLGANRRVDLPRVRSLAYPAPQRPAPQTHRYLRRAEASVRHGQQVARVCLRVRAQGFDPDLVIAHPGWGETLFLREVLPRTTILSYCEMFYRAEGQDTGYIPETAIDLDGRCRIRAWNADLLTSLDLMDHGIAPTRWQRDQHPAAYRSNMTVIHDGVDTSEVAPAAGARFQIPGGPSVSSTAELVTFVARDLEPVRGFTLLMHALPELLSLRPDAHIVICGGDGVSYGRAPADGTTWRETMLRQTHLPPGRVHFVGKLPRPAYLDLLRVSALHLYLTVPFVLSWSCIEALAAGCLLLGSDVEPVREVIEDGVN
ncbi:MAG: glycosyltransferase, partial [Pseudomonadota bacterium]|nr:glycosyltransferase [Pseudomonadota bacterium]